jgi:hypothetical protein
MRHVVDVALLALGLSAGGAACSSEQGKDDDGRAEQAGAGMGAGSGRAGSSGSASGGVGGSSGGMEAASGTRGTARGGTGAGGDVGDAGAAGEGGTSGAGVAGRGSGGSAGAGGSRANGGAAGSGGKTIEMHTLTIEFLGDVPGEIVSSLHTFTCEETCTRTLPEGHEDTYRALPVNGAGTYFGGFGGDCEGLGTCELVMDEDKHITVEFRTQTHNFVFLSSKGESTSHGGASKYDDNCNELATAAGINNTTNDAYVAWVSDSASLALERLGDTARGWVRLDERPVADTMEALLAGEIYNPIRVDEWGVTYDNQIVGTGTLADGSASPDNCNDFRSEAAGYSFSYGTNYGGPTHWSETGTRGCQIGMKFYCFGTTLSEPVVLAREEGKLVYLSEPFRPNAEATPDEVCASSAPSGVGEVRAMVTYSGVPGAAVLNNPTRYVRPDGQFVGNGAEIVEAAAPGVQGTVDDYLRTGIWQAGDGRYLNESDSWVWVGDINITRGVGTGACGDWTTPGPGSAIVGDYRRSNKFFWNLEGASPGRSCDNSYRFYCVEQ